MFIQKCISPLVGMFPCLFLLASHFSFSIPCRAIPHQEGVGGVGILEIRFTEPKSRWGSELMSLAMFVVVSVDSVDANGNFVKSVYSNKVIPLHQRSARQISVPLSLATPAKQVAQYVIKTFAVLDAQKHIIMSTPLKNSAVARYVNTPLGIRFALSNNQILQQSLEVVEINEFAQAQDYGYVRFDFLVSKPSYQNVHIAPMYFSSHTSTAEKGNLVLIPIRLQIWQQKESVAPFTNARKDADLDTNLTSSGIFDIRMPIFGSGSPYYKIRSSSTTHRLNLTCDTILHKDTLAKYAIPVGSGGEGALMLIMDRSSMPKDSFRFNQHEIKPFVCADGTLYVPDAENHRVLRFVPNEEGIYDRATLVGGNDGFGSGATQMNTPYGVAVNSIGALYVADQNGLRFYRPNTNDATILLKGYGAGYINFPLIDANDILYAYQVLPTDLPSIEEQTVHRYNTIKNNVLVNSFKGTNVQGSNSYELIYGGLFLDEKNTTLYSHGWGWIFGSLYRWDVQGKPSHSKCFRFGSSYFSNDGYHECSLRGQIPFFADNDDNIYTIPFYSEEWSSFFHEYKDPNNTVRVYVRKNARNAAVYEAEPTRTFAISVNNTIVAQSLTVKNGLLFIPVKDSNAIEVYDIRQGTWVQTIKNFYIE